MTRVNESVARIFSALGDPTRLGLVNTLCKRGPLSIAHLTAGTEVTRQGITKHLRVLEEAGVVKVTRSGREAVWEIEPEPLHDAEQALLRISARWDGALERLKKLVEEKA